MQVNGSRYCWHSTANLSITFEAGSVQSEIKHVTDRYHSAQRHFRYVPMLLIKTIDRKTNARESGLLSILADKP